MHDNLLRYLKKFKSEEFLLVSLGLKNDIYLIVVFKENRLFNRKYIEDASIFVCSVFLTKTLEETILFIEDLHLFYTKNDKTIKKRVRAIQESKIYISRLEIENIYKVLHFIDKNFSR